MNPFRSGLCIHIWPFVFSQKTLRLQTVLCDEGLLTEVRTAAACAFASKLLLGKRVKDVTKIVVRVNRIHPV